MVSTRRLRPWDTAASSSYVTLLGRGSLMTGARGSDFMLIRIVPDRLEVVSESRGMIGDPKTWLPLSIDFPGR